MATRIRSANFSTDADDYIKLTAEGLGNFAKTNFPTTASGATAAGADAIAIGRDANAGHTNSVALGYGAVTNANHQVRLGGTTIQSIRVGNINYDPSDSQDLATKGYVDSQISATIDSSYISARASSFDSGNATGLIDSAYIQARQVDLQRDSAYVKTVQYGDDERLKFGASSDLQLYHSGSHSFVRDQGTGHFYITTNGDFIHLGNGSTLQSGRFSPSGSVELAYNGSKKLETTSTGITVTSTDSSSSAGPELVLYKNSASPADGDYLGQIKFTGKHDGGGDEIYAKVTGKISDASSGTEDGLIETAIKGNGSFTIVSRQKSNELQLLNGVGLSVDGSLTLGGETVDSAWVNARSSAGIDSAATLNIVDSSYIGTVVTTTRLPGKTISDLRVNPANLARSHTVDSTDNALLVGPYNVDSGVTLTINGTLMVV